MKKAMTKMKQLDLALGLNSKMILNFLRTVILIVALFFSNAAYSQDSSSEISEYKLDSFAVVNVKRIVDESKAAKTADKEVKALQKKYIKEAESVENQLKKREEQLQKQQKALSQEAFVKKIEEFKERIQKERKEVVKKRKILEASYVSALELIKKETLKVIAKIADKRNIDIVLPTSQILYFRKGVDISDEVLKELDKELPKVKINVGK